ncbi:Unknown protein [Striga hermonthica]|uniref:Tyrosinase copper-binding domain-containing protein n=1 Tax=Striga hermonthica TaxID=68872 RepID=A0A9N7NV08_STRHE|nr:Unknown protein [Striga hermonthica]
MATDRIGRSSLWTTVKHVDNGLEPESWLFFPFHRWYLYFFERICARLLDDDTFALPFWNWDDPSGMEIPAPFDVPGSPLHDRRRNQTHLPPAVADLNWDGSPTGLSPEKQRYYNLSVMYKQMVTNGVTPRLFMGQPFKAGDDINSLNGAGSIETAPHNTLHVWTGDPREPNVENMGVFYSAARDPIFYTHHANIDRLWTIWAEKLGGKVFTDPDWLETSFVFYNEDKKPVRVKIKDCLNFSRLGYAYQEIETPWLNAKPKPRTRRKSEGRVRSSGDVITDDRDFPRKLNESLNIVVKREPLRKVSSSGKKNINENEEEVLVIEIAEYDIARHVKFDVYVNEDDVESCMPDNTEFLGSFVSVPRGVHDDDDVVVTSARGAQRFGLSNVVAELGVKEDDVLMVTLVPRRGCAGLAVGDVRIEFDASGP